MNKKSEQIETGLLTSFSRPVFKRVRTPRDYAEEFIFLCVDAALFNRIYTSEFLTFANQKTSAIHAALTFSRTIQGHRSVARVV
jgi:hypothetical protein